MKRCYMKRTETLLHSEFVRRATATLKKRSPIKRGLSARCSMISIAALASAPHPYSAIAADSRRGLLCTLPALTAHVVGLVHHSDRGVQYACHACRELLEEHGMAQSMSRAGKCYDKCYDNANDEKHLG